MHTRGTRSASHEAVAGAHWRCRAEQPRSALRGWPGHLLGQPCSVAMGLHCPGSQPVSSGAPCGDSKATGGRERPVLPANPAEAPSEKLSSHFGRLFSSLILHGLLVLSSALGWLESEQKVNSCLLISCFLGQYLFLIQL